MANKHLTTGSGLGDTRASASRRTAVPRLPGRLLCAVAVATAAWACDSSMNHVVSDIAELAADDTGVAQSDDAKDAEVPAEGPGTGPTLSDAVEDASDDAASEEAPSSPVELPPCLAPTFPQLERYPPGTALPFEAAEGTEVALTLHEGEAPSWSAGPQLVLPTTLGSAHVHARSVGCDAVPTAAISARVEIADGFASADDVAVTPSDPAISGWATEVVSVVYGSGVDETWRLPEEALGPAGDDALATLVLGNGGQATLAFEPPIRDELGPDFAVFENAFLQFYELAFVEVSSDGVHFERFASRYLGTEPVSPYGYHDSTWIGGLAGKHPLGYGTPFDLEWLHSRASVQIGLVDLDAIRYVRIIDIVGDGGTFDSFGSPIYDPTPTVGSGGFDLDAVARLGTAP